MRRNSLISAIVGAVAGTVIAGGVAWATVATTGTSIDACYQKATGAVRVIDPTQSCRSSETAISWNQVGSDGPSGDTGAQGIQGVQGPPGQNGADGRDGISATTAPESGAANCVAGGVRITVANGVGFACNGVDGTNGTDGTDGSDGPDGPQGPPGHDVLSGYEIVRGPVTELLVWDTPHPYEFFVSCPSGKHVVGGGYVGTQPVPWNSMPYDPGYTPDLTSGGLGGGWFLTTINNALTHQFVRPYAICAYVG
jgi:hypothetical protein